jgi:hypothetical protein
VGFAVAMAGLGIGMGLMVSQLGNVVQSSVDASGRSEAGGLQYTSQQVGSSLGVALIGAIVITALAGAFVSQVGDDERISDQVAGKVGVRVDAGLDFLSTAQVQEAATSAGLDPATAAAIVDDYAAAQLSSLKLGLLAAGALALASLPFTRNLPHDVPERVRTEGAAAGA